MVDPWLGGARSHPEPDRHGRPGRIDPGAGPMSSDLTAAMRLLDLAKHRGFSFQRVAAGPDGPLWGVRESLEYRDTVYLAGFGDSCSATRAHRASLIVPG